MEIVVKILIGFVAILHLYFFYFESFAWTSKGPKIFKHIPKDLFPKTKSMMANQGLYNGFLAAGLIWTFFITNHTWQIYITIFFLGFVLIAGIVGAFTVSKKIFWIQGFPALLALFLIHLQPFF